MPDAARLLNRALRLARMSKRATRYEVHAFWRGRPIETGLVLYEAFSGTGILDNPEAIFRELLADPEFAHLRHVWVLDDLDADNPARVEFRGHPRVSFVRKPSQEYFKALATAEYLVNNATFPPEFSKRDGQVYLNTWHGTPLKTMGYDMPDGALEAGNTLRNFVSADYLLSQNAFMSDTMYGDAYRLKGHYRGRIIEEGYPRVDRQYLDDAGRAAVRRSLEARGLVIGERRVVVYAPTWKGSTFSDPRDDVDEMLGHVAALQKLLGDDYAVLLRTHQIVQRFTKSNPALSKVLVPHTMPTNVALGLADVLITDYSSIFFDFLATGRPIAFFVPPTDTYADDRGTYFTDDELPGPLCTDLETLATAILRPDDLPDAARRRANRDVWQERFTGDETGQSAKRVIDVVFRKKVEGYRIRDISASDRTSILLYAGGLNSNGITTSLLNLLQALPADRLDVSVVYNRTKSQQLLHNQKRIPSTVRQFPRDGGMNGSKVQHLRRRLLQRLEHPRAHLDDPRQRALWDDEWQRLFGLSRFDHSIDFSGYGPFWASLMLHAPGAKTSMWLHNDIVAEVDRLVGGKPRMRRSLPAVYRQYEQYDALVAVSKSLAEINMTSLAHELHRPLTIGHARNLMNPGRDARRARVPLLDIEFPADDLGERPIPGWARDLARHAADRSRGTLDAPHPDGTFWFVTVGRFSPEKNQARLVRAFARVHAANPGARLVMVGHGGLRATLQEQIDQLGLTDVAHLVGPLANPLPIVAASDCFVLSSNYEGQPMVLLEAAGIGLPIVSTDFASVRDALPEGAIEVVAQNDGALEAGLAKAIRGGIPAAVLDEHLYNEQALAEFYAATGVILPADSPRVRTDS